MAHRDTPSCMHHQVDVGAVVVLAAAWRGVTSSSGMGRVGEDGIAKGGGGGSLSRGHNRNAQPTIFNINNPKRLTRNRLTL